jgi:predicted PurR-regulated permease PerM
VVVWLKDQLNLNKNQFDDLLVKIRETAGPLALGTTQFISSFLLDFLVGLVVMIVGLYYFLADGPEMISALMRLSPLDDRYEAQLLDQFSELTRAVILAMLLAALVQGLLAGVGYFLVDFGNVFMLTVVTMVFAMVPFVGATAVWGGCCLWLALHDGRPQAAIGLAIYGTVVVSVADNLIKPMVLHGRSNLHPLLALLSVLGGAKALGAIGIVLGPIVVAFLQTLLVMLRSEMLAMDSFKTDGQVDSAVTTIGLDPVPVGPAGRPASSHSAAEKK